MSKQQSSNGAGQVIPFGKYRGQPLEVLEKDPEYLNWLTNQDWFRTGHANLYQIVINNFAEPCDTPEHNQMQAMFLDKTFRLAFARHAIRLDGVVVESACWIPIFESSGVDVCMRVDISLPPECNPCSVCGCLEFWNETRNGELRCSKCHPRPYFYFGYFYAGRRKAMHEMRIEIKPSIGDNFPSVMRQMNRSKSKIIFIRNYNGTGIDEMKFVEMFNSQEISVVFENEIKN